MSTLLEAWLERKAEVYLLVQKIDGKKSVYWSFDGAPSPAYVPMIKKSEAIVIIKKLKEALEDANEFTTTHLEDMEHYFDNKCVPTVDEVNQCAIADSHIRLALAINPEKL